MGWLTTIGVIGIIVVALFQWNNNEANRQMMIELAKHAAVQRPHLDSMCASYFRWAETTKERVPGMERHCSKPFIEVTP